MGHDNTIALMAGVLITAVALAGYIFLNNRSAGYRHAVALLTAQVDQLEFPISCTPQGRLDNRNKRNCVERNGYRIVRSGLDAIIVKIDKDKPVVVFRSSPDRWRLIPGSRDEIKEILRVFSNDQQPD